MYGENKENFANQNYYKRSDKGKKIKEKKTFLNHEHKCWFAVRKSW